MFQLYKNIQTDFLGQIFLELFQFKTRSLFWDTQYSILFIILVKKSKIIAENGTLFVRKANIMLMTSAKQEKRLLF